MKQKVLNTVENLRKKGDYQYTLSRYVNPSYWVDSIKKNFNNMHIENLTDFNYSTCFTLYLNISQTNSNVGTEEFSNFIRENHSLYRVQIQISAIAPYATYKFVKYVFEDGKINMKDSFTPFLKEHDYIEEKVIEFLNMFDLLILDKTLLSIEIPDISLEMRKSEVTVYHCLFEDEY